MFKNSLILLILCFENCNGDFVLTIEDSNPSNAQPNSPPFQFQPATPPPYNPPPQNQPPPSPSELALDKNLAGLLAMNPSGRRVRRASPNPFRPVPLRSVNVNATIKSWATDVTAVLEYQNDLDQNIECQFVFPIAQTAAVYKLEAVMGGTVIVGQVKDKTTAQQDYTSAVNAGRQAALLESQDGSPDVYRLLLGNLGARQTARVTVAYAMPLDRNPDTGDLTLTLPVVLNPRYVPSYMWNNAEALARNFQLNTPYVAVSDLQYQMGFAASIDMGSNGPNIVHVRPGQHQDYLSVQMDSNYKKATVRLTSPFVQDHDFQIKIQVDSTIIPTLFYEPGDASQERWKSWDVAGALVQPKSTPATSTAGDHYWIVVDRSGSMKGSKLVNLRSALFLLVKSLPTDCKFGIVGFGYDYNSLFPSGV